MLGVVRREIMEQQNTENISEKYKFFLLNATNVQYTYN